MIFIISIVLTAVVVVTGGIVNAGNNIILVCAVIALIMMVNAGYGGGFSNVPTLLSDHYGMSNISAIHGITLSAWAFAGLTGNQMAAFIVDKFGKAETILVDGHETIVNPTGYQTVLYVTLALYIVSLLLSIFFVRRPAEKAE